MKKFGKKTNTSKTKDFANIFDSDTDDSEMSKKLKMSNTYTTKVTRQERININTKSTNKLKRLSEMENNNLYLILNVDEDDDPETIKRNYKNLCKLHHPDKGGNPDEFNRIQNAYKILSNNFYRRLYTSYSYRALSVIEHLINIEDKINFEEIEDYGLEDITLLIQMNNN
jgi:hypothetical protein